MDAKNYSATTPPIPGTSREDFRIFEGALFDLVLGGAFSVQMKTCTFARDQVVKPAEKPSTGKDSPKKSSPESFPS